MESKSQQRSKYRQNLVLITSFFILISLSFVLALFLAYKFTQKFVEGQFDSDKAKVLDKSIEPYNELLNNEVPKFSLYQGFLESESVGKISKNLFANYPFISSLVFYDLEISNHKITTGLTKDHFSAEFKSIHKYQRNSQPELLYSRKKEVYNYPPSVETDFSSAMLKFISYVEQVDTNRIPDNSQIFNNFYTINDSKVSFLNVPRRQELSVYKDFFKPGSQPPSPTYEQDLVVFHLDPTKLKIENVNPQLYQNILIKSFMFDSLSTDTKHFYTTGISLPGAFSDYQLYFISTKEHLNKEIYRIFTPLAIGFIVVYLLVLFIAYLIFRNLNINQKLFKLQYDFINNLTHEFKTPVSVIKIAGDNIRSSDGLTDRERLNYGRILNEEADKLNDLMTKLLSFTQLENKSIKLKFTNINLEVFCQNLVDAYHIKYPDFNVEYQIEDIAQFETDAVLLNSVFTNMMDNAYKYSAPGNKYLNINVKRQRKAVVFKFVDQGIGIEKGELENIFKKFYKVENEFNRHGSVGIGLAFCKEIVNFMNGDISVKSKLGQGSEFKIILPLRKINSR
ncbi:sensor histidine kinase [Solitalea lacus]|uniref:sensor histidine kinase n=1 Tax=Solitalea lacus TaxID=2911172 RepID=UPI001EDC018B|nr:HAMP domain-containing sensor histidine kinase [Solitalea lacus]UKJ07387.1 HAMP domain-containing histidine kinase [Solitalea lacus]